MVSSSGTSVIDLLDEIASIEVDIQGNISYRGNQNVVIHINGRPTSLTGDALTSYLRSIPSDFIEQVETIPNPFSISCSIINGLKVKIGILV